MRAALWCGVAGPVAFVAAWLVAGLLTPGYSPVDQPISRLAASGADTRPLTTAGFVAFGVLLPVYALALRRLLGSRGAALAAAGSGIATLAVAALPLSREGGQGVDTWHAVAAGCGYAAQVLAPLLGGRHLRGRARTTSYAVAALAAACLVGSLAVPGLTGLLQRTGLTAVDAWYVAVAAGALRRVSARG